MATKEFTADTSSNNYKMKLTVDYDADSTAASQDVTLQLWIKKTDANYTRMRHNWEVTYSRTGKSNKLSQVLPDDNAGSKVESAGRLSMTKGTWYKWGSSWTTNVPNDGSSYTFGVAFKCLDTIPRSGSVSGKFKLPIQPVIPGKPKDLNTTFDAKTRKITYNWTNGANTSYCYVERTGYRKDNSVCLKTDWLAKNAKSEVLPDDCTRIVWKVYAYSSTNHRVTTSEVTVAIEAPYARVWVYHNGKWCKTIPWVYKNGKWKRAIKAYVYTENKWKQTTT